MGFKFTILEQLKPEKYSRGNNRTSVTLTIFWLTTLYIRKSLCILDRTESSSLIGSVPCLYEGHLRSDRNWFGYLANISIISTGRMTFEFSYAADRCCQNILFYTEEQVAIINARMNCWQKEYLLRPEDDQILRLTPRFSWSGCHMTQPSGIATYICQGGRSFTADPTLLSMSRPMTWYVGVSNCATLDGLDLRYRMMVYNHLGDCPTVTQAPPVLGRAIQPSGLKNSRSPVGGSAFSGGSLDDPNTEVCVVDGQLNTTKNWFGFICNISLGHGGGFRFLFRYPTGQRSSKILLYREWDVMKLSHGMSCWQKEGTIPTGNIPDQILDLDVMSSWNGCIMRNSSSGPGGSMIECRSERRYNDPRTLFIAYSNCRSDTGLALRYRLEIFGYVSDVCRASLSVQLSHMCLVLSLVTVVLVNRLL